MKSIERTGLTSEREVPEAHHLAWEKHREVCADPSLYKIRERRDELYLVAYYACPNCSFTETIWKNRRRGDAAVTDSLAFSYEPPHAAV